MVLGKAILVALLFSVVVGYDYAIGRRQLLLSYAAYCGSHVRFSWLRINDTLVGLYVELLLVPANSSHQMDWQLWGLSRFGLFLCSLTSLSGSVFGYVVVTNDTAGVIFRGTDNMEGWIRDANFKHVPYPGVSGATVHEGKELRSC
jgi:hypothetical protein